MRIGRHDFMLDQIAAITPRNWFHSLFAPGFTVYLRSGAKLHFTPEEKEAFDAECEVQNTVRQLYDVARGAGLKAFAS